ncbi:MAG: UMP kinase [Bacteroidota bacterium]|nr:UMP kinase [Bacteroidota bacterium]MDP4233889.1 UMP kinase [Bacteroidota bacterium]MDP4243561.1 UMP kinase [Bacteroidota bacterium]MDP4288899.1 UMP kinase [Bacteroidota bacterium]
MNNHNQNHHPSLRFRRVLLKLSGEALMGDLEYGIDPRILDQFAREIVHAAGMGVQIGIVVGGGNIFRGVSGSTEGISRVQGDQMGMLATMINALALQNAIESKGLYSRLMSAITMNEFAEPFIRRKAIRHLEKGRVVIFGCGTGNPFFTTDTAAALRAVEIGADAVMKGTRVDGIYDSDPEKNADALRIPTITYMDVLQKGLRVMDLTAITLCQENQIPIIVFNMNLPGNLERVLTEDGIGSVVA